MLNIETILRLNSKLSYKNLIYRKFKPKWLLITFIPPFVGFSLLCLILIPGYRISGLISVIPSFILIYYSIIYSRKKTQKVVEKYYSYALNSNKKYDQTTLVTIRKIEFLKLLKNTHQLNKNNIPFIIEALKNHYKTKHYNNPFIVNTLTITTSIYLGSFLSGISNFEQDINEYFSIFKLLSAAFLLTLVVVFYLEQMLIRNIILNKKEKENRLIRILENIYLERSQK